MDGRMDRLFLIVSPVRYAHYSYTHRRVIRSPHGISRFISFTRVNSWCVFVQTIRYVLEALTMIGLPSPHLREYLTALSTLSTLPTSNPILQHQPFHAADDSPHQHHLEVIRGLTLLFQVPEGPPMVATTQALPGILQYTSTILALRHQQIPWVSTEMAGYACDFYTAVANLDPNEASHAACLTVLKAHLGSVLPALCTATTYDENDDDVLNVADAQHFLQNQRSSDLPPFGSTRWGGAGGGGRCRGQDKGEISTSVILKSGGGGGTGAGRSWNAGGEVGGGGDEEDADGGMGGEEGDGEEEEAMGGYAMEGGGGWTCRKSAALALDTLSHVFGGEVRTIHTKTRIKPIS